MDQVEIKATHKKAFADMSEAHQRWLLRWEADLAVLKAQHVWAAADRGKGRFYLALKVGAKQYRLVAYDRGRRTVKPIGKVIASPTAILEALKPYRAKAAEERKAAKAAK